MNNLALAPAPGGLFTLTGQPKGQEKRVARLTLTVTAEGIITGIEIEETDGALTRFTFTGEVPNKPIPPQTFHFTPPLGVPVVDALPPVLNNRTNARETYFVYESGSLLFVTKAENAAPVS